MRITAYRIVKSRYQLTAFSGEGAKRYGGRWSSLGRSVVYVASSKSLAMLEMLVHLQSHQLLQSYVVFRVEFESSRVENIDTTCLPSDWRASPASPETQLLGDAWIESGESAVLKVPSAIVEGEDNYLLNPEHPDFATLIIGPAEAISFDPRLK